MTALFALLPNALAANTNFQICIQQNLDYEDQDIGDFLTGTSTRPRGAQIHFYGSVSGHVVANLAAGGSDPGCADVTLDDTQQYSLVLWYRGSIAGNTVEVVDDTGNLYTHTISNHFSPPGNGGYVITFADASDAANIYTAAAFGLFRNDLGVTGETFRFITDVCPNADGSCERWPATGIFINTGHRREKLVILHEFGHAMSDAVNQGHEDANAGGAAVNACSPAYTNSGHKANSKEFNSNAAVEGVGDFYAAVTVNDVTQSDCEFRKTNSVDWDLSGAFEPTNDPEVFSCEAGMTAGTVFIDAKDYLGDFCIATGASSNRGTQYDWLRMGWDFVTDKGQTVDTFFQIWDHANPHTWRATDVGINPTPAVRMSDAAYEVGGTSLRTIWDTNASSNGTDR